MDYCREVFANEVLQNSLGIYRVKTITSFYIIITDNNSGNIEKNKYSNLCMMLIRRLVFRKIPFLSNYYVELF